MSPKSNQMCDFARRVLQIFTLSCKSLSTGHVSVIYVLRIIHRLEGFRNFCCLNFVIDFHEFQVIPLEEQFIGMNKVTVWILHAFECSSLFSNLNEIKRFCRIACKKRHK